MKLTSKNLTITYVVFFMLLLALLLAGIVIQRIEANRAHHMDLAANSVKMTANEISRMIGEKRRLLHIFSNYESGLIDAIDADPEDEEAQERLNQRVLSYFPDGFAFTLADRDGSPLYDDLSGAVGELCQLKISDFAAGKDDLIQIHPNPNQYHFDIMVTTSRQDGLVFFVSFQTTLLQNLLRISHRHQHQLILLNTEKPNLIEVTEEGNRYELQLENPTLTEEMAGRILARQNVPGTLWELVDIGAPATFNGFEKEVITQAAWVFLVFFISSMFMVGLILRGKTHRLRAEQALLAAKDQLEIEVASQTQQLRARKVLAETTLASISEGVITTNAQGVVTALNHTAQELTGWGAKHALDCLLADILNLSDETTGAPVNLPLGQCLTTEEITKLDNRPLILTQSDGKTTRIVQLSVAVINGERNKNAGNVLVVRDITDAQHMAKRISWQATHDALTGLINRLEFERRLQTAMELAHTDNAEHVLMYLDLDQFKVVNDTCGHIAGDELLRQLTQMLLEIARRTDVVARLGGDEFAILLEYCPQQQAIVLAEEIRLSVRNFRFTWGNKPFTIGVSIGVVPFNARYRDLTQILSAADSACYAAKEGGRNRVHVYSEDDEIIEQRYGEMQWVSRIRHALDEGRFLLYCQKIQPIRSNSNSSFHLEILLRMEQEGGQMMLPGAFIPAAERYGLMIDLDRFVISDTLQWMESCPPLDDGFVSINLSAQSITDPDFLKVLESQLESSGVDPCRLLFEVTETATISNLSRAQQFIERIKSLGCRFALDDFGTGMSSFAYLKHLPVDYLKIDGEFVRDIASDPVDFAMVKAINEVAQIMGMDTIAEYVEDSITLAMLKEIGIGYGQGYAIAKPEPLSNFYCALSTGNTRTLP
ncbi:MAG: EAL domain-containing protein [gamma proteobacterium endosymbiont of Lamellibrachia anaximandri]|nr:EAL domain-containing protein [gamma proteobacterium endosymbiont of Lamellibrachia anaximandri]